MTYYQSPDTLPLPPNLSSIKVRGDYNSRNAHKFQVRFMPELHVAGMELADLQMRSFNAEMVAAILSGLDGHSRISSMVRMTMAELGSKAEWVVSNVEQLNPALAELFGDSKYVIRFPATVREAVLDIAGHGGMNRWINEQLITWLNLNRQLSALMDAYVVQTRTS